MNLHWCSNPTTISQHLSVRLLFGLSRLDQNLFFCRAHVPPSISDFAKFGFATLSSLLHPLLPMSLPPSLLSFSQQGMAASSFRYCKPHILFGFSQCRFAVPIQVHWVRKQSPCHNSIHKVDCLKSLKSSVKSSER